MACNGTNKGGVGELKLIQELLKAKNKKNLVIEDDNSLGSTDASLQTPAETGEEVVSEVSMPSVDGRQPGTNVLSMSCLADDEFCNAVSNLQNNAKNRRAILDALREKKRLALMQELEESKKKIKINIKLSRSKSPQKNETEGKDANKNGFTGQLNTSKKQTEPSVLVPSSTVKENKEVANVLHCMRPTAADFFSEINVTPPADLEIKHRNSAREKLKLFMQNSAKRKESSIKHDEMKTINEEYKLMPYTGESATARGDVLHNECNSLKDKHSQSCISEVAGAKIQNKIACGSNEESTKVAKLDGTSSVAVAPNNQSSINNNSQNDAYLIKSQYTSGQLIRDCLPTEPPAPLSVPLAVKTGSEATIPKSVAHCTTSKVPLGNASALKSKELKISSALSAASSNNNETTGTTLTIVTRNPDKVSVPSGLKRKHTDTDSRCSSMSLSVGSRPGSRFDDISSVDSFVAYDNDLDNVSSTELEEGEINSDDEDGNSCEGSRYAREKKIQVQPSVVDQMYSHAAPRLMVAGDRRAKDLIPRAWSAWSKQGWFIGDNGDLQHFCSALTQELKESEHFDVVLILAFHNSLIYTEKVMVGDEVVDFTKTKRNAIVNHLLDVVKGNNLKWKHLFPNTKFVWVTPYPVDFWAYYRVYENCIKTVTQTKCEEDNFHYWSNVKKIQQLWKPFGSTVKCFPLHHVMFATAEARHNFNSGNGLPPQYLVDGIMPAEKFRKNFCLLFEKYIEEQFPELGVHAQMNAPSMADVSAVVSEWETAPERAQNPSVFTKVVDSSALSFHLQESLSTHRELYDLYLASPSNHPEHDQQIKQFRWRLHRSVANSCNSGSLLALDTDKDWKRFWLDYLKADFVKTWELRKRKLLSQPDKRRDFDAQFNENGSKRAREARVRDSNDGIVISSESEVEYRLHKKEKKRTRSRSKSSTRDRSRRHKSKHHSRRFRSHHSRKRKKYRKYSSSSECSETPPESGSRKNILDDDDDDLDVDLLINKERANIAKENKTKGTINNVTTIKTPMVSNTVDTKNAVAASVSVDTNNVAAAVTSVDTNVVATVASVDTNVVATVASVDTNNLVANSVSVDTNDVAATIVSVDTTNATPTFVSSDYFNIFSTTTTNITRNEPNISNLLTASTSCTSNLEIKNCNNLTQMERVDNILADIAKAIEYNENDTDNESNNSTDCTNIRTVTMSIDSEDDKTAFNSTLEEPTEDESADVDLDKKLDELMDDPNFIDDLQNFGDQLNDLLETGASSPGQNEAGNDNEVEITTSAHELAALVTSNPAPVSSDNPSVNKVKDKKGNYMIEVLKILSNVSNHFGPLSASIVTMHMKALEYLENGQDPLALLTKSNTAILEVISTKLRRFIEDPSTAEVHRALYKIASRELRQLLDNPQPDTDLFYGVNIVNIAKATVGSDTARVISFIRNTLTYHGYADVSKDQVMKMFMAVKSVQLKLLENEGKLSQL